MARIKPGAASTRDYPKVQEGDAEEYYGTGPDGMAITSRKRRGRSLSDFESGIASMKEQGLNRIDPKYATPDTAAPASEPPPTFNDKDWNLKTG